MEQRLPTSVNLPKYHTSERKLRSSYQHPLATPKARLKTYGERAFAVAAPRLWIAFSEISGYGRKMRWIRMDASRISKNKFAFSQVSGHVWTGHMLKILLELLPFHFFSLMFSTGS